MDGEWRRFPRNDITTVRSEWRGNRMTLLIMIIIEGLYLCTQDLSIVQAFNDNIGDDE